MAAAETYARRSRWLPYLMIPLFLVGTFLVYQRIAYESRDFYAEYFKVYIRSESIKRIPGMRAGLNALDDRQFELAASLRRPVYEKTKDPDVALQLAMAQMEEQSYWEAIDVLQKVKDSSEDYIQEAEWYKILCLIALERKEEAIGLLEYYCEQPDFTFKEKEAKELLRDY